MPILGTIASSTRQGLGDQGAMFALQTLIIGPSGASGTIFRNIPSTYSHLQLRWTTRSTGGGYNPTIQFNNDTAANYAIHYIDGNGTTVASGGAGGQSNILIAGVDGTANTFSTGILDIYDYANTNKFKTVKMFLGNDYNGSGAIDLWSGLYRSTSAISTINLNFFSAQYSRFSLYGIKAAS